MSSFPFDRPHVYVGVTFDITGHDYDDSNEMPKRHLVKKISRDIAILAHKRGGTMAMMSYTMAGKDKDERHELGGAYAFESEDGNIDGFILMVREAFPDAKIEYDPTNVTMPAEDDQDDQEAEDQVETKTWNVVITAANMDGLIEKAFDIQIKAPLAYGVSVIKHTAFRMARHEIMDVLLENDKKTVFSIFIDKEPEEVVGKDVPVFNLEKDISELPYYRVQPFPHDLILPAKVVDRRGNTFQIDVEPWFTAHNNANDKHKIMNCLNEGGLPNNMTDQILSWMINHGHEELVMKSEGVRENAFDMTIDPDRLSLHFPTSMGWPEVKSTENSHNEPSV